MMGTAGGLTALEVRIIYPPTAVESLERWHKARDD